jgi:hypothetical protein
MIAMAVFQLLLVVYARTGFAQTTATKTFSSAEEACIALFQAAKNGDEQGLQAILGAGKEVTSSGDDIEDKLEREQFTRKYQEMRRLVREADGSTILYLGAENWPFPIPLISTNGVWHFDPDAGKREILFRTIGENEASALQVCDAFVMTKKQGGAREGGDDPIAELAQSLVSVSSTDGTKADNAVPQNVSPFHGYYFRSDKSVGHVALVAYPAKYRSSGVMTFLVTQDGIVYEKDLGPNTTTVAPKVKVSKLGSHWHPAE